MSAKASANSLTNFSWVCSVVAFSLLSYAFLFQCQRLSASGANCELCSVLLLHTQEKVPSQPQA